ncbi:MAG: hypothetical protein V9G10_12985 [Candidatus Nanopelagicales bacterium]
MARRGRRTAGLPRLAVLRQDGQSRDLAQIQDRLRAAYPETELMALQTEPNPVLLPPRRAADPVPLGGRLRHDRDRQAADRHPGRRARHAFQVRPEVRLGEERRAHQLLHHPEPRAGAHHQRRARGRRGRGLARTTSAFCHANPLQGPGRGRHVHPAVRACRREDVWRELPRQARRTIRDRRIQFLVVDAFSVAKRNAPTAELETRMMGIAFIGAVVGHVDRVSGGRLRRRPSREKVHAQIVKKFGDQG